MKPEDLNIEQWQDLLIEYKAYYGGADRGPAPIAMRCENSQLELGWKMGGFTMNGHLYTAFCPKAVHGPCAMLAVRDDFLKWVAKRLKEIDSLTDRN